MICEFKGEHRFLSNFFESPITVKISFCDERGWQFEEFTVPTVEHGFQGGKTVRKEDFLRVIECDTPGQSKRMGQKVQMRDDWDEIKVEHMQHLLGLKFSEGSELGQMLVDTHPHNLVEGNRWNDRFWGVGLDDFQGENWLGRLLMQRRDELRQT